MGNQTTDKGSPGLQKPQQYSVGGGLSGNNSDDKVKPVSFLKLINCLPDKRIGAILKRPGSKTETITSGLGLPLGCGEFISGTSSGSIPTNRTLLFNFAGSQFWQNQAGKYSQVSFSSRCNFATSKQCQFTKIGSNMLITGGLPAKWGGPGTIIERVGIDKPVAPMLFSVGLSGTGTLQFLTGVSYMYTFFDSVTGLESDWGPMTDSTGPTPVNVSIGLVLPTPGAGGNYDSVRIYRTLDGGNVPYLVATIPWTQTAYGDISDDGSLTLPAALIFDRAAPPPNAYICATYSQCNWMVDASNPYRLVFSKPYIGSDADLEYYPVNNFVITAKPITGLYVTPGKLLIFHPRAISMITGFSVDDFALQPFLPGTGTVFPNSISTNGDRLFFLGEQGAVSLPIGGGTATPVGREIDHDLQPLLAGSYNSSIYVSSAWNVSLRQFILSVMAQSTANAPWEEVGTGDTSFAKAGWENVSTSAEDFWEDVNNPNTSDNMRVKIWGWSAELSGGGENIWSEYTLPGIEDDNTSGAYPIFMIHPEPSSDTSDPQQDKTFFGIWNGTQGEIRSAFRRDSNLDDSGTITATLLTSRLAPGMENEGFKFFQRLGFMNAYSDPTSDGEATIQYLIDFDDPHLRDYSGSLIDITDTGDGKKFPQMQARHVHMLITDTSESQSKILLSEFFIHFRERFRKYGR